MPIAFIAVIAALLYLAAAGIQLANALQRNTGLSRSVLILAFFAIGLHLAVTWDNILGPGGVNFGFFPVLSLIFVAVNIACLVALTWRPLENLLIVLFPLSAVATITATMGPDTQTPHALRPGVALHVGSSIVAYSLLTLAAMQAALLAAQDAQLRARRFHGPLSVLPPLQLMESMLFELLWAGVLALTLSIATGFLFMEDIFAQHLVHKTVLSLVAWILFSVLLWGRHSLGWRSQTAVRLTVMGFTILALAFMGSKLVLELILERG
ncbi:MAG: cytochrome c biogenesis protein CcsA [Pseudomonadota bacterium]